MEEDEKPRKERRRKDKKHRREKKRKAEAKIEQPRNMLTPGHGPQVLLTPRHLGGDVKQQGKRGKFDSPPLSPRESVQINILETDFVKREPMRHNVLNVYPLPPEPAGQGYVGQYVQSALTGDFKHANHAPAAITPDDPTVSKKQKPQTDLDFRNIIITVNLAFSHLRAALLVLFMLVLFVTNMKYSDFIWHYKSYSDPLQKTLNVISYLSFAAALCPLAVVLQPDPEHYESKGCVNTNKWTPFVLHHILQAILYGGIVLCCVYTATFDDVLWEHRLQIDHEYKPRSEVVMGRMPRPLSPGATPVPVPAQVAQSNCHINTNTVQRCEDKGCCWCEDCATKCDYPSTGRASFVVESDPTTPFSYSKAVEICSADNSQLCSFSELCGATGRITAQAPISDGWNWFVQSCSIILNPVLGSARYTVYCCKSIY
eukprot:TRINITY_DN20067_c0_g1_i1.p1 TRINITY_DN20067_c0_g1~~TRINITY_DN20067_c0_g1_i1.p1  ORF type:complete len:446 (+),score=76.54 TRINITY_DN20067_c0_g1_i1:52-1338(+)